MVPLIVADSPTLALAQTHVPLLSKEILGELVVVFSVDDEVSAVEVLEDSVEVSDVASVEDSDESAEFSMAN